MDKWPFFEKKTYPPIWLKFAQNIIFGPIIMMKKASVRTFMKNFHGAKMRFLAVLALLLDETGADTQN